MPRATECLGECRHREGLTGIFRGGNDVGTCVSAVYSICISVVLAVFAILLSPVPQSSSGQNS